MRPAKKKKTEKPQPITRPILRKELSKLDAKIEGVHKELDAKIDNRVDSAVVSMKDYADSRFNQLSRKMDEVFERMDEGFRKTDEWFAFLANKLDQSVKGIVDIIERQAAETIAVTKRVDNHEERIVVLEEKMN